MANQPTPAGPAVTSANVPKFVPPVAKPVTIQPPPIPEAKLQPPADEAQLPVYGDDMPTIVARPLSDPDFDGIQPKNPMHKLYWANRGHQNGIRVGYRQAQGFRLANKNDVLHCPEFMIDPSGQIINGDRVLMIIGKNAYEGALLNNHNKSIRRVNKFGQLERNWREGPNGELIPTDGQPVDIVSATVGEVRSSPAQRAKIRSFVPNQAELAGMVGDEPSIPQKP